MSQSQLPWNAKSNRVQTRDTIDAEVCHLLMLHFFYNQRVSFTIDMAVFEHL